MLEFLVPFGYGEAEFTEKKSRFTGRVWLCETEREALDHIAEMRSVYWDATHNVFAYSIRESGATRFSDDGEPQGTAGMPVLDVFRREGIHNFLCVVTRYFGGILLGTGGLVRAYANAAKIGLEAASIAAMRPVQTINMTCPYPLFDRIKLEAEQCFGSINQVDFGTAVQIKLSVPEQNVERFNQKVTEVSAGLIIPDMQEIIYLPVRI